MRQFASKGFRLWQLPTTAKLVYTVFCLFTLLGLLSSVLYFVDLMGVAPEGAARYYRGAPTSGSAARSPVEKKAAVKPDGPSLDLPPDDPAARPGEALLVGIPYRKLIEVSHFHLFTVPVVLLILAHLFMLTDLREPTKIGWIGLASLASFVHLAAPWLVRYVSPGASVLMPTTGALMLGAMAVLTGYPIYAMWWGGRGGALRRRSSEGPVGRTGGASDDEDRSLDAA
jgi:hypothetical protein